MDEDQPDDTDVQEQLDDLRSRATTADQRASARESRADKAELRADDSATRADAAEGLISSGHTAHLEGALQTARTIGAAIGIVMTLHRVNEVEAFEHLKKTSQDSNQKLRLVAEEVVLTGDTLRMAPR